MMCVFAAIHVEFNMSSSECSGDDEKSEEDSENSNENDDAGSGGDGEESVDDCEDGKGKEGSGNSDSEGEKTDEKANSGGTGGLGEMTNDIQAETVLNWENNKEDLNDETGRDYFYMNVPESNLDSIVVYKRCMESLKEHYANISNRYPEKTEYNDAWMDGWMYGWIDGWWMDG